jgi:hypothetical protein
VVVKATAPRWFTLQVPRVIARTLGLRGDRLKAGRRIAFLNRGPGVARVVPWSERTEADDANAVGKSTLAVATFTEDLLFTLPRAVQDHLGLRVSRRGNGRVKGTDDLVVWMVPEREWEPGSPLTGSSAVHVYLTRSLFPARCNSAT